jgi:DNA-binding GntR family transcriptional regulator
MRQDQVAEQFGVGKIPVREAMVQLRAEGLIEFIPDDRDNVIRRSNHDRKIRCNGF